MIVPKGARGFPPQPFAAKMPAMPSGLGDPTQEQSGPVPTPASALGPSTARSPMAAKVRAALMLKLRGGK